jgi:exonuclease VII large subunit
LQSLPLCTPSAAAAGIKESPQAAKQRIKRKALDMQQSSGDLLAAKEAECALLHSEIRRLRTRLSAVDVRAAADNAPDLTAGGANGIQQEQRRRRLIDSMDAAKNKPTANLAELQGCAHSAFLPPKVLLKIRGCWRASLLANPVLAARCNRRLGHAKAFTVGCTSPIHAQ